MVNRYLPTPVLHRVVEKDGFVFVGGTACDDTSKDIKGQTLETLEKMEGYLHEAGSDKNKVLFATIYLASLDLKAEMSEVWVNGSKLNIFRRAQRSALLIWVATP